MIPSSFRVRTYAEPLVRTQMGRVTVPMSRKTYPAWYHRLNAHGLCRCIAGGTTYGVSKKAKLIAVKVFSDTG